MGEANPEAWEILTRFLGQPPRYEHRDDKVILHLGKRKLETQRNALWDDPSVFGSRDALRVFWGGKELTLRPDDRLGPAAPGGARRRTGLDSREKLLRLPMRYIDGRWMLEFGGDLPIVHGAEGELLVEARLVEDSPQKDLFLAEKCIPVLKQGTTLLAIVDARDLESLTEEQRKALIPRYLIAENGNGSSRLRVAQGSYVVPVTLGPSGADPAIASEGEQWGLWLRTQGVTPIGLKSREVLLPPVVSPKPASSLNHALTLLSQTYESWRRSHTGSVYRHFLYQEESHDWHPLGLLREGHLASTTQAVARDLWQRVLNPST